MLACSWRSLGVVELRASDRGSSLSQNPSFKYQVLQLLISDLFTFGLQSAFNFQENQRRSVSFRALPSVYYDSLYTHPFMLYAFFSVRFQDNMIDCLIGITAFALVQTLVWPIRALTECICNGFAQAYASW